MDYVGIDRLKLTLELHTTVSKYHTFWYDGHYYGHYTLDDAARRHFR